jgi:hypothetical protein
MKEHIETQSWLVEEIFEAKTDAKDGLVRLQRVPCERGKKVIP